MVHNGIPPGYGIPGRDPSSRGDNGTTRRPSHDPRGFLGSIAIALLLLMTTAAGEEIKPEGGRLGLVSGKPARHPGRKSQR